MTAIRRGRLAVGVATGLLLVLPPAGAAGGLYVGFVRPDPPMECGLWVLPAMMVSTAAGVLGFVAGVGAAWLIARGLFRWANGCSLGDIRDDREILEVPQDQE